MTTRMLAALAALALAAAAPAAAQVLTQPQMRQPAPGQPGSTQPAPAPRPGEQGQAKQVTAQLNDRQKQMMAELHQRNGLAADEGTLAAQRGASAEVKQLGQRLADEHKRADQELTSLLAERSADPKKLPKASDSEKKAHDATLARLRGLSGADFDRAFVAAMEPVALARKTDAGRMRDETPGADWRLKGWLDSMERLEITHVDAIRHARDAVGAPSQVQARRPAPAPGSPPAPAPQAPIHVPAPVAR